MSFDQPRRQRSIALIRLIRAVTGDGYREFLLARRQYEVAAQEVRDEEFMLDEILSTPEGRISFIEALYVHHRYIATPLVVCQQYAVGHGGFHTGTLGFGLPKVRWIYDCGSWRTIGKRALSKAISSYISNLTRHYKTATAGGSKSKIDIFFISHFDTDHVSGIREFLGKLTADTVVIPYLEVSEKIAIVLASTAAGIFSDDLFEIVFNPGSWFGERGVRRVIRVRSGPPGDGDGAVPGGGPSPADDGAPDAAPGTTAASVSESRLVVPLDSKGRRLSESEPHPTESTTKESLVDEMEPGGLFEVRLHKSTRADWTFVPHVSSPSMEARERVKNFIETMVGPKIDDTGFSDAFLRLISDPKKRKTVKAAYLESGLGDANAVSLSLYSGPAPATALRRTTIGSLSLSAGDAAGWLLTGDAALGNKIRREAWISAFSLYRPLIGNMMIPHHGANSNFHEDILTVTEENARLFVTANSGDSSHPHEDVRSALDGRKIEVVSEKTEGRIRQVSGPDLLPRFSTDIVTFVENWT